MTVSIHQPEYLPCLALVAKIAQADLHVVLDDVQFNRASLQHRAKILPAATAKAHSKDRAPRWMTIPFVHRFPQLIREVDVADHGWPASHAGIVEIVYRGSRYYARALVVLDRLWHASRLDRRVSKIARRSQDALFAALGVTTRQAVSSDLNLPDRGPKGDGVLAICKAVGATCYLAGRAGALYLDRAKFADAGIDIAVTRYHDVSYCEYDESDERPSVPGLSALDVLMHAGDPADVLARSITQEAA